MKLDFTESDHSTVIVEKALKQSYQLGIAEGLRMAAEMFRNSKLMEFKNNVLMGVHGFDFYHEIMAKAKEVEEGEGEK